MKGSIKVKINKSLYENAKTFLPGMYDSMVSHQGRVIGHPRLKAELHRMRVTGKPLRYAMEMFEPTFGKNYESCLNGVKYLIELMGEVHDCDVTKLSLQNYLHELRLYNKNCTDHNKKISLRGINQLIHQQKKKREKLFAEMCSLLRAWKRENFRNKLMRAIH